MPKKMELSMLIDVYAPVLTEKQREVIELYYYEDLSLAEIAEHSGISRQGVRDAIKRGETIITDLEEKLGFAKHYKDVARVGKSIKAKAEAILECNTKVAFSEPVKQAAEGILSALKELE